MVLAPSPGVRDIHLITQYVPYDTWLIPCGERFNHRHVMKLGQTLVTGQASTIDPAEHLFKQLPEFTFTHAASLAHPRYIRRLAWASLRHWPHNDATPPRATGRRRIQAGSGVNGIKIVGDHAQHLRGAQPQRGGD